MSNPAWFRYEWIWHKSQATQFLDANRRPLKAHESVLVFSSAQAVYYPVMAKGKPYRNSHTNPAIYSHCDRTDTINDGSRYPTTVIQLKVENGFHPTQKPVDLFSYLIRTYTRPGELVLDPTCGSGTTAIAARNEGRRFICGDSNADYVQIARNRLAQPYTMPMFADVPTDEPPKQTSFL